jgi:hypothetical protein
MALNEGAAAPEGQKKVARGWSEAETPGGIRILIRILKGCEIYFALSHPFRMRPSSPTVPGIYASLQPLAIFLNPFGVIGLEFPLRSHAVWLRLCCTAFPLRPLRLCGEGAFRQ